MGKFILVPSRLSRVIMHGFNSKVVILATNMDARPDNAIPTAFGDERLITGLIRSCGLSN